MEFLLITLRLKVGRAGIADFCDITGGAPRNVFGGGVQQIQLRTEYRQNGDLGAVAP